MQAQARQDQTATPASSNAGDGLTQAVPQESSMLHKNDTKVEEHQNEMMEQMNFQMAKVRFG